VANRIKQLDGASVAPDSGKPLQAVHAGNAAGSSTTGAGSSQPAAASGAAGDSVYITQSARALAALSQAVQDSPNIDFTRVATLQRSIDEGLYRVDPNRIAGLMMQLEQDLNGMMQQ